MSQKPIVALDMPTEEEPLTDRQKKYLDICVEKLGFVPKTVILGIMKILKINEFLI